MRSMKINENQWKSLIFMVPYARGMQKNNEKIFRRGKIEKLHFYFPSKNMIPHRMPEFRMVQLLKKSVESC